MPVKVICKQCSKEFFVKPSVILKGKGIFCSKPCSYKYNSENNIGDKNPKYRRIKSNCKQCNKELYNTESRIADGRGVFCSKKCMGESYKNKIKGASARWLGEAETNCKMCNKPMVVRVSRLNKGEGSFCSYQCVGMYNQINMKKTGTKIELAIENLLLEWNIDYIKQHPIKIANTIVDFYLSEYGCAIYCDGDYWHRLENVKLRDEKQTTALLDAGYRVVRLTETDIKTNSNFCKHTILEAISGNY